MAAGRCVEACCHTLTISISQTVNLRSSGGGPMDATGTPGVQQQIEGLPEAAKQHWQLILAHARSEPLAEAEALRLLHVCLELEATGIRLEWGSVCTGKVVVLILWLLETYTRLPYYLQLPEPAAAAGSVPHRAACTASAIRASAVAQSGTAHHA